MYINRVFPNSLRRRFDKVYKFNLFGGQSSKSGVGSSLEQTQVLIEHLPTQLKELGCKSILDIPCGDIEWIRFINFSGISYIGADISPSLIEDLRNQYTDKKFLNLDIVTDSLPKVDLIFCRDLFVHLSYRDIRLALKNIGLSGITYIATTTFTERSQNKNLPVISRSIPWRTLNLELEPFSFPSPLALIRENCREGDGAYRDKSVGFWKVSDIPLR